MDFDNLDSIIHEKKIEGMGIPTWSVSEYEDYLKRECGFKLNGQRFEVVWRKVYEIVYSCKKCNSKGRADILSSIWPNKTNTPIIQWRCSCGQKTQVYEGTNSLASAIQEWNKKST